VLIQKQCLASQLGLQLLSGFLVYGDHKPRMDVVSGREKEIGGSAGSLESPGPFLTRLHIVYMDYSGLSLPS
jgi:hypothetical protein